MIKEVRFEFIKRLMGFLIKISKGDRYLDKLENSYKNNLLFIFFLTLALVGTGSKYIQLYFFTNDARHEYTRLLLKEEHWQAETQKSAQFARSQFRRAQQFEKDNYILAKKVHELTVKNEELEKENRELLAKLPK